MAEEELTVRMNTRGARRAAGEVDRVEKKVRSTGRSSKKASLHMGVFSRALLIVRTRAVIAAIAVGILGVSLFALLPSLAAVTAASVSLMGIMIPGLILAAGAALIFHDTVNDVGSSAAQLLDMFAQFKHAFRIMVAPAAAAFFQGLIHAMEALMPLMESLRPVMHQFGMAAGQAVGIMANALAGMGPQITTLIEAAIPAMFLLADSFGPVMDSLLQLAIFGLPVMMKLLGWIVEFMVWLPGFVQQLMGMDLVQDEVVGTLTDLWGIAKQTFALFSTEGSAGTSALMWAIEALRDAIHWLNVNFDQVAPLVYGIIAAFIVYKALAMTVAFVNNIVAVAMGVASIATGIWTALLWLLNAAILVLTSPITLAVLAIAALAFGFYYAYQHSETFRNAIDWLGRALKNAWTWIKNAGSAIYDFLGKALDWVVPKIEKVIDLIARTPLGGLFGGGGPLGGGGVLGIPGVPLLASGGTVTRGGAAVVGEEGPELVNLPGGSTVTPNGGGDVYAHVTLVMPDGEVLARQVVKASRRKEATR